VSAPTTDPGTRQRAVRPPLLPTPRPPLPYDGPVTPTDPLMRRVEPLPPLPLDPPRDRNRAVLIALGAVGALLLTCIVIATAVLVAPHVAAPARPAAAATVTAAPAAPTGAATPSALPGGATVSCLVSCSSTAPSPTTATDREFIAGLTTAGLIPTYGDATQMLSLADETCNALTAGMLWAQTTKVLTDAGFTPRDADAFMIATTSTYCPKFVPHD
jgi:hypothetical protein